MQLERRRYIFRDYHETYRTYEPQIDVQAALLKQSKGQKVTEMEKGAIMAYEQRTRQQRKNKRK